MTAGVVAAASAGAVLARRLQGRSQAYGSLGAEPRSRWWAVTINRSPDEVLPDGQIPEPLARLGDLVEVEVVAAPGSKGTELRARLRSPRAGESALGRLTGQDPRQQVRSALREAKQLIETGEVLRVDPVPHGKRPPTPAGWLVELATKRARGEGVL
jgi:hypothetical protein